MNNSNNKDLMSFPCDFALKVFGKSGKELEMAVLPVINKHVKLKENAVKTNNSKNNKYISLTINFRATSKAQLDEIYKEVTSLPEVIMAL